MKRSVIMAAVLLAACVATAQAGVVYVDGFDGGANPSGWEYAAADSQVWTTGGNPDGMLHGLGWSFNYPELRTGFGAATPFHGDYRAAGVDGMSMDLTTYYAPSWAMDGQNGFTGTLILFGPGMAAATPLNANMLDSHAGWHNISVAIPSAATSTPAGWYDYFGGGLDWNTLITGVEQVQVNYFDGFGSGMDFEVGVDNITLTPEPGSLALLAIGGVALIRRRR